MDDAFRQSWEDEALLWVNPPFTLLPQVIGRLAQGRSRALLLFPDWHAPWTAAVAPLLRGVLRLPPVPLFSRRNGAPPLPAPRWRVIVGLVGDPVIPRLQLSSYHHNPVTDGDVESNPGPVVVPFLEFATKYGATFLASLDRADLARHTIDLRHRSEPWSDQWLMVVYSTTSLPASVDDCYTMLAAYEIYSRCTLQWDGAAGQWQPSVDPEVASLRERLRLLELRTKPPTEDDLAQGPSADNVARFLLLPSLPPWLVKGLRAFESWTADPDVLLPSQGVELWHVLVEAYFRGNPGSPGPRPSSQRPGEPKSRPAPFGLAQLKDRGGRVETEVSPGGVVTFAYLDGDRYYLSKKGALWNTQQPPPAPCYNCGSHHWFWECPQTGGSAEGTN